MTETLLPLSVDVGGYRFALCNDGLYRVYNIETWEMIGRVTPSELAEYIALSSPSPAV